MDCVLFFFFQNRNRAGGGGKGLLWIEMGTQQDGEEIICNIEIFYSTET